jgi:hypothetical protein
MTALLPSHSTLQKEKKANAIVAFCFGLATVKKAMAELLSMSLLQQ